MRGKEIEQEETHLDLGLRHAQRVRQLGPLGARQVLGLLEGLLQREDLLPGEGGSRVLLLRILIGTAARQTCRVH